MIGVSFAIMLVNLWVSWRKPEPAADASKLESLRQMREEDDAVYKSMRGISRGC